MSTLHAFAQRLLVEHPIEAGLPPRVEVVDEIQSQVAFDERWTRFVDRLLDDETLERTLLLGLHSGLDPRQAARPRDRVQRQLGPRRPPHARRARPPAVRPQRVHRRVPRPCARSRASAPTPDDLMARQLVMLDEWLDRLEQAPDEYEQLRLVVDPRRLPQGEDAASGRRPNWANASRDINGGARSAEGGPRARHRARRRGHRAVGPPARVGDRAVHARGGTRAATRGPARVPRPPRARTRGAARSRARLAGAQLPARALHAPVARRVPGHRSHPVRSRRAPRVGRSRSRARRPWDEITVEPGRLFVVGDPKQSIYRFRRADIAAFLRARDAFGTAPKHLTRNFRTVAPVIEFVNHVFADLITATPDSQPEYVALQPVRGGATPRAGGHPPRRRSPRGQAACRRAPRGRGRRRRGHHPHRAPRQLAGRTARARRHRGRGSRAASATSASCCPPARRSGSSRTRWRPPAIPARAETSSLVYGTREIRDLLVVLHAVDDPTDELALVTALRSPLFGCGDDDLYTFAVGHRGRWNHQAPLPESLPADHPVGRSLRVLAAWHDARQWLAPSELLDRIVRERRVLEVGFAHGRPRDLWRRVRFVIDQAARVLRGRGRQPARLPPLGRSAERGGLRASSRPSSPRPTTTRCASSPSTGPRASSSRSRSSRA